jgi:hypothetical protein
MSDLQDIHTELRAIRALQQNTLHILYSMGGYEKNPIPWVSAALLQSSASEALSAHLASAASEGASSAVPPGHSAAEVAS